MKRSNSARLVRDAARVIVLLVVATLPRVAAAFDVSELMSMLSRIERSSVSFEETKTIAALIQPLVRRGTMLYVRPDRLEMQVDAPFFERLEIVGDRLTIETRRGIQRLDLATQPVAGAWVESIRATLAGDAAALSRHYRSGLAGDAGAWRLEPKPLNPELARIVARIAIAGAGAQLVRIEVDETQGDRTVLLLSPQRGKAQ